MGRWESPAGEVTMVSGAALRSPPAPGRGGRDRRAPPPEIVEASDGQGGGEVFMGVFIRSDPCGLSGTEPLRCLGL